MHSAVRSQFASRSAAPSSLLLRQLRCLRHLLSHSMSYSSQARATPATAAAEAEAVNTTAASSGRRVRLAVVGDVHGQWGPADVAALKVLQPDAVLWVGDIGNEDVALVRQIAALTDFEKAIILGNHCAWYTMTARGRQRASQQHKQPSPTSSPASPTAQAQQQQQEQEQQQQVPADGVQQQLDVLGGDHVGWGHKALRGTNISIVGARPFSKGGQDFSSMADFLARFGVGSMQQSAEKVLEVISTQVPAANTLVILAHNGPAGLGREAHSICGCDWVAEAGDWGDPDLALVLQTLQAAGRRVALVLHGHMHHMIKGGRRRQMAHVDTDAATVFLNAATVPRVVPVLQAGGNGSAPASRHHFLLVDLADGAPCCAADVWVHTAQQPVEQHPSSGSGSGSNHSPRAAAVQQQGADFLASTASAMHGVQHSKSKTKTAKAAAAQAAQDEARRRLQLQAPQQLHLQREQRQPQQVDGYQVHVAEVYEVLRQVQPEGGGGGGGGNGGAGGGGWEYFDAHMGHWVKPAVAAFS